MRQIDSNVVLYKNKMSPKENQVKQRKDKAYTSRERQTKGVNEWNITNTEPVIKL